MNEEHKYRILFLLHLPPPVHGSSYVGLSIKDSVSINQAFECQYINLLASQNLAEAGKSSLRKIFSFAITFIKVFWAIISKRPEFCYLAITVTGSAFYKDMLLVALLKLFRIKRVYHLHNKGVGLHKHKRFIRMCYYFVFKKAEVILLSKYLYPDIQEFVPEEKVHICANGIADLRSPKTEVRYPKTNDSVQILFLSNLIESKGIFVLLDAMALLAKKEIGFEGVIVGGEGNVTASQFYERVAQLDLSHLVSYQGGKYGEEKSMSFSKADIFVFPTYFETFGLVNLEAMQHSLPIVSTFEGGIPDVVADGVTGFLVQQRNSEQLAEKLELLLKDPALRQQMGQAGRLKYENEFTIERFEKRLLNIFESLIRKLDESN